MRGRRCSPHRSCRRRRKLRLRIGSADDGSYALEYAFVAPVLLFIIFLSIQAGMFFYGRAVAISAAREGVSQLRLYDNEAAFASGHAAVDDYVAGFATAVGRGALQPTKVTSTGNYPPGEAAHARVSVTVTGRVMTLVPGFKLKITERETGIVERFEGDE